MSMSAWLLVLDSWRNFLKTALWVMTWVLERSFYE